MGDSSKNRAKIVLILGMVGIIGVIFTIISDLILLGRPESAYSFFMFPTECMTDISQWRIVTGTFLGVFMLPFQIAGMVPVYHGLKTSGKAAPIIVAMAGAHGLIMGAAFHTTYAFMASGWKLFHTSVSVDAGISAMVADFEFYWKLIIVIMAAELLLISILFAVNILRGKSLYPKWMAVCNPLLILAVTSLVLLAIPAPVGGYAAPTVLNLSNMIFFIISTAVVYKRINAVED